MLRFVLVLRLLTQWALNKVQAIATDEPDFLPELAPPPDYDKSAIVEVALNTEYGYEAHRQRLQCRQGLRTKFASRLQEKLATMTMKRSNEQLNRPERSRVVKTMILTSPQTNPFSQANAASELKNSPFQ